MGGAVTTSPSGLAKTQDFLWYHAAVRIGRYLVSNLIGISLPNGFDTTASPRPTTWSRLGRPDRDDIQREFDKAAGRLVLRGRFRIP